MPKATNKLTVKQIKKKVEHLKAERTLWNTHWQEVTDFILPRKNTIVNKKSPGQKRGVNLFDTTGIQSNEVLSGALHGLLTNPDAEWFELTTGDLEIDGQDDVRKFLQKTTRDMHNILNNSNFQTEIHELYTDLCAIGTSPMYMEEDDKTVVRFKTQFIAEVMVAENNLGVIDQVYREWEWDAATIVAEFGLSNVPEKIKKSFQDGGTTKYTLNHAVYPRAMVDPNHKSQFNYISQYVLPSEDFELKEAGYREFPYVVPRWSKSPGEVYGRSPGMNALPEVKTLNKMTETMIIGAQKVADPPLQLPDDGFILPIVTSPGGLNFYRSGTNDYIRPVFADTRLDFGQQAMQDRRMRIREAYYIDQLQMQQGPQMTATEVLQRTEEKMRLLGPMLGRMQSEFLRPMIDRLFEVMIRRGLIRQIDIPALLRGKKLDVKYSSLIAKSQRLNEGQNILRFFQAVTPLTNIDPTCMDNIDANKGVKIIAATYGLPQEMLRNQKDVVALRAQKAQAQAAALQQQQQQHESQIANQNADTLSKINPNQAG